MSDILRNILAMGKEVAPLIEKLAGTTMIGTAIQIGQGVLELGKQFKANHAVEDQAELDAMLAEVEARVSQHLTDTADSLG